MIKFICVFLLLMTSLHAKEISFYDDSGEAVAYIDTNEEMNIYSWHGDPVAYLERDSIFGFNGKHLGWFENGIIRDHSGYAVGFVEGSINKLTKLERLKSLQKLTPLKSLQQLEPIKPFYHNQWARLPLEIFLASGKN